MKKFILLTFVFLGWGFYELSGGADFDPYQAQLTNVSKDPLKIDDKPIVQETAQATRETDIEVTRVALNLTSVDDVLTSTTRPKVNLPQQPRTQRASLVPEQGESVVIIPSLVAGADPVAQPQQVGLTQSEPQPEPVVQKDIRTVSGSRVNVRGGPGTSFGIVDKMVRGDAVEVLEDDGSGWVRLRPLDGGPVGYMADFLLSEG